ncbi:MAG: siphovirus ReqiPepy6 Gp37-like family protein [Lachnospiraceae bacterium]|nr:siphovirus ReqiPepy6 Gp37-like family protein [Lachnospiraceae bacterium]
MQIKLFNYSNNKFNLLAIIDDIQQASFEHNYYAAGQFTITLNYNIPNAKLFKRGLFVQFGSSPYDFGEITSITNSIGENGKGSEFVNITGYDARYLFKRRIISNLNNNDAYNITADGETCIRSLISSQCTGKRSLPVNMGTAGTLGETYTVSESYSNLYDVLQTIATQTNIGWRLKFSSGALTLEVYQGEDKSKSVFFSEEMDSLKNGTYQDSNTSYANAILIAGKGSGSERDIYEGEELIDGDSPAGLDRFEAFDNQAELTTTEEYETEADAMLRQYGQTLTVQGAGLIKSPYVFREQYDIGDYITLSFSDKTAKVQITSVTEQISWNNKTLSFTFGKPVNGLDRQLDLMLKKIQSASSATSEASTNSVKWYTTPTDTAQDAGDVTFNTLGFTGSGGTFTLYLDDEKTGSKSYHLYIKNLTASLVLTTNKGATDLTLISGSYIANIFVDEDGNIINQGMTATSTVEAGNNQPVTSDGVNSAINALDVSSVGGSGKYISAISETDGKISATVGSIDTAVTSGSSNPITSRAMYRQKFWYDGDNKLSSAGWYKVATFGRRNHSCVINLRLATDYNTVVSASHDIKFNYSWQHGICLDLALDNVGIFSKIKLCYNENNSDTLALYVYYNKNVSNDCLYFIEMTGTANRTITLFDFVTDSTVYDREIEYNLGTNGLYVNGVKIN